MESELSNIINESTPERDQQCFSGFYGVQLDSDGCLEASTSIAELLSDGAVMFAALQGDSLWLFRSRADAQALCDEIIRSKLGDDEPRNNPRQTKAREALRRAMYGRIRDIELRSDGRVSLAGYQPWCGDPPRELVLADKDDHIEIYASEMWDAMHTGSPSSKGSSRRLRR